MYGSWTHSGCGIVALVAGPGHQANHEPAHFVQDIGVFRANTEFLYENFGIQYLGPWHSHHELGLDRPSGGDAGQIRSISIRNRLSRLVEIVTTHHQNELSLDSPTLRLSPHGTTPGACRWPRPRRRSGSSQPVGMSVKINSFEHTDPQSGQCRRCSIRVLPGISPFRLALRRNGPLHYTEFACQDVEFPMERILFDSLEQTAWEAEDRARTPVIPETLVEQCEALPAAVADKMTVRASEGLFVFELPASSEATVVLVYDDQAPHVARAVGLKPAGHDKKLLDLTTHALADGPHLSMGQIYAKMASFDPCMNERTAEAELSASTRAMTKARTLLEGAKEIAGPHNGLGLMKKER